MPDVIAKRVLITGRVQGVGFRDWMLAEAGRLALSGWVRNVGDDIVEALVAGEKEAVLACLLTCRRGPPLAAVENVIDARADPPAEAGFHRRPSLPRLA